MSGELEKIIAKDGKKPNILMVIHDFKNAEENVGGTTLHTLDIIRSLREKYNFHVLTVEGEYYKVYSYISENCFVSYMEKRPDEDGEYAEKYAKMLMRIMDELGIGFVQIQHMMGHYFDIGKVCEKKQIKYIVVLHDLYLLKGAEGMFREDEKVTEKLRVWQKEVGRLLMGAERVIVPSKLIEEEYGRVYKGVKFEIISHGINVERARAEIEQIKEKKVAFVGVIAEHKGREILKGLLEEMGQKDGKGVSFHLYGKTDLDEKWREKMNDHGVYKREELTKRLRKDKIGLVCIFSTVPESFSYTTEEVVAAGVPILTFDLGAGAERVKRNNLGWVVEKTGEAKVLLERIEKVFDNREEYAEKVEAINKYKVKTTMEMVGEYEGVYVEYAKPKKLDEERLELGIALSDEVMQLDERYQQIKEEKEKVSRERDELMQQKKIIETEKEKIWQEREMYKSEFEKVINSKRWRMMEKIRVPGRRKS